MAKRRHLHSVPKDPNLEKDLLLTVDPQKVAAAVAAEMERGEHPSPPTLIRMPDAFGRESDFDDPVSCHTDDDDEVTAIILCDYCNDQAVWVNMVTEQVACDECAWSLVRQWEHFDDEWELLEEEDHHYFPEKKHKSDGGAADVSRIQIDPPVAAVDMMTAFALGTKPPTRSIVDVETIDVII